jgi:hypothetical protein
MLARPESTDTRSEVWGASLALARSVVGSPGWSCREVRVQLGASSPAWVWWPPISVPPLDPLPKENR